MASENITPSFQAKENYYVRKGLTPLPVPHITGMKLLGDVSIGDLVLNTRDTNGIVWVCTEIENWWTLADPDYPKIERSFGDGSYDVSGRYLQRDLSLEGSILVPSPDYAPAARDTLVGALDLVYSGAWLKTVENQGKSATTTTASLTSNVATITTSTAHGFSAGNIVTVSGSVAAYNGTYTITAVTTNTFSYAKTNANIASAAFTGTATVGQVVKAAWVRLANQPKITSQTPRGRINFSVDLTAPDPIKYQWSNSSTDGYESITLTPKNTATSATGSHTVTNSGNATVGVLLNISGSITGPLTISNTTTKQKLTVASSIVSGSTLNVAKKAFFDGLGTLTTSGPHGLFIGKEVVVAGVDTNFNGTYTVEEIPANNKFSFSMDYGTSATFNSYQSGKTVEISTRSLTSNVALITTSSAHGFVVGMEVLIAGFTSAGLPLNGIHQIASIPSSTTFTFNLTNANIASGSASTATATGNIVTVTTSGTFDYSVGDLITVKNMNPTANAANTSVLSVSPDKKSLTYYSSRIRSVKSLTFENTPDDAANDQITLTTWERHGVRVGDTIYVQGCGRPVNSTIATATATATATDVTEYSVTYQIPTFTKKISTISVAAAGTQNYRVTVTLTADMSFQTGDAIRIRAVVPGGTEPIGINGTYTINRTTPRVFYYDVKPKSTTPAGLIEFFGASSGEIKILSTRNNYVALANIQDAPINSQNTNGVGGRLTCFAVIPTTQKTGGSYSDFISETPATGTVTFGGDTLVLDTKDRSAYLNNDPSYARGKLAAVTDWIKLAPGQNTIVVEDTGNATSTASITMQYRSGWLA